jgi:hypothetical protein
MTTRAPSRPDLDPLLQHWMDAGLISREQAQLMRADLSTTPAPADLSTTPAPADLSTTPAPAVPATSRGPSLVTEAVGYLGGVIVVAALGLITGQFWPSLPTSARLALAGGITAVLLAAGWAVPAHLGGPGRRLRAVLWVASSLGFAAFLALAAGDGFGWDESAVATFAAGGTAVFAAVLWFLHRHPLQHVVVAGSLLVTAGAATTFVSEGGFLPGVAVWGVAVIWLVLAWGQIVRPRRVGVILGGAVAVFSAMTFAGESWGSVLAVTTVAVLVAAAVLIRDLVLLGVTAVGTLTVLPVVIARFFPGVLAAALVLLIVGLLLLAAAVVTARRRRGARIRPPRRDWSSGPPAVAVAVAAVIAVATTAAILGNGLSASALG